MESLQEKIRALPKLPGCYLFYNKNSDIIYIGKSKSLRYRVRQYFQNVADKEGKYKRLAQEIADVEIILTPTERDALLLECRLIKTYKPWYNAQLKRDREYPYIMVDIRKEYPTITIETTCAEDTQAYFGFFYNEDAAFDTITLLNRIWQTPLCCKQRFPEGHRPCLNYHLQKCCAPCIANPAKEEYRQKIQEIIDCLSGKSAFIQKTMLKNMQHSAQEMDYEKAAYYRDILTALDKLRIKSGHLANTSWEHREMILLFRAYHEQEYSIFYIQDGRTKSRLDPPQSEQEQDAALQAFTDRIYHTESGEEYAEEERFLTVCLLDIFADKYFIPLPRKAKPASIYKSIKAGIKEFES